MSDTPSWIISFTLWESKLLPTYPGCQIHPYYSIEFVLIAEQAPGPERNPEHEERRLLIETVLLNATWDGISLQYDYKEPFNLLAEMNESTVWGPLPDIFRTKIIELNNQKFILHIQKQIQINDIQLAFS